jgi:hypothetical protein
LNKCPGAPIPGLSAQSTVVIYSVVNDTTAGPEDAISVSAYEESEVGTAGGC